VKKQLDPQFAEVEDDLVKRLQARIEHIRAKAEEAKAERARTTRAPVPPESYGQPD
jgi:hypothetical protein